VKGTVSLRDLKIVCVVGIHPREREIPQPLLVDLDMDLDIALAAETQEVSATVDYSGVAAQLTALAQNRKYLLIEAFAEESAALLFDTYPPIQQVQISVKKPNAVPAARHAAVKIVRLRDSS
jgi:dihydroneopterin aldolase